MPNRLASELSPYLLQHRNNPVDWYPWGEDAFGRARSEDKPIFLSVGYSTCHWCHVMEHESFENPQVADVLNRSFVSVKVDREERPDVDRVYMAFVQATTGSGGWPMSVWLTPALQPFYGGTYFPPSSRWGRPGFVDVLEEIARVWREERDKVVRSAATIVDRLRQAVGEMGHGQVPGPDVLNSAVQEFAASFDAQRGGFGAAPKFPRPSELLFLLREHARTGASAPRDMVLRTLRGMALGGMRDHLGGGFHRYSVDADWRVPHFEKMLYDQAQLVLAYLEAAQVASDPLYVDVAIDTLAYVRRDLMHPDGGFFSAEDADSLPPERADDPSAHKMEGAFYIWRDDEIGEVLGADADIFRMRYGVLPQGNAPFDPQAEFTGKNLLYTARNVDEIAAATASSADAVRDALARSRSRLLERRNRRPRPHLDDKVLTAWNGLMIAAFARAARFLEDRDDSADMLRTAQRAASFVRAHMWNEETPTLLRRYREGHAGVDAYAEDYAYLIFGLLELFQADGDPAWLAWALELQRRQDELFWDDGGGWFSTSGRDQSVLLRLKDDFDGAEPSATSMGLLNLLTLAHLVGDDEGTGMSRSERIDRTLRASALHASRAARGVPMRLAALSSYHGGIAQLVIVGERDREATEALWRAAMRAYHPSLITVPVATRHRAALMRLLPWVAAMEERGGHPTAYVCRAFACRAPVNTPPDLIAQLASAQG